MRNSSLVWNSSQSKRWGECERLPAKMLIHPLLFRTLAALCASLYHNTYHVTFVFYMCFCSYLNVLLPAPPCQNLLSKTLSILFFIKVFLLQPFSLQSYPTSPSFSALNTLINSIRADRSDFHDSVSWKDSLILRISTRSLSQEHALDSVTTSKSLDPFNLLFICKNSIVLSLLRRQIISEASLTSLCKIITALGRHTSSSLASCQSPCPDAF